MNSEKIQSSHEQMSESWGGEINRKIAQAVVDTFAKGAKEVKEAHRYDNTPLDEIKEQDPDWLKQWALNHLSSNGESAIGKENENYRSWHFEEVGAKRYGERIGYGPQLSEKVFLDSFREKNPGATAFAFKREIQDEKKTGKEIIVIVNKDFDEMQLPDGYGLRESTGEDKKYSTCNIDSYQAGGVVICHRENYLRAKYDQKFHYGKFNAVFGACGDYGIYPEEYRVVVKKDSTNTES